MNNQKKAKEICIYPIGYVESELKEISFRPDVDIEPEERKKQLKKNYKKIKDVKSKIYIDPEYEELLDGIEGFSHILVIFWPHLLPEDRRNLKKVHPMGRKDIPLQGIFATRSPARPNPILVSSVELIERKNNVLYVKGLEALDESPIFDIKPVTRNFNKIENARFPEWIEKMYNDLK